MEKNKNIRNILFISVVILCVLVAFGLFIKDNAVRAKDLSVGSLKDSTYQTAKSIDDIFDQAQSSLIIMSTLYENMLEDPSISIDDLSDLTQKTPFDLIEFVDTNGINTAPDGTTTDVSAEDYFKYGMQGKSGVDVVFNPESSGENLVVFYSPVYYNNEIFGVIAGIYYEETMNSFLYNSFLGEDSRVFLCTDDGYVVSCSENVITDSIFNDESFNSPLDDNTTNELKNALLNHIKYEFQYNGQTGKANAYVTPLDKCEWNLIQTFPSQATQKLVISSNRAGIILLVELIVIFVVYIIIIQIFNLVQKKKLVRESTEKSYIIDGITQIYETFVLIDFEENTYKYLAGTKSNRDVFAPEGSYDDFKNLLLSFIVDDDEKERMETLYTKETLQRNMDEDNPHLRYEYRIKSDKEKWGGFNIFCLKRVYGVPTQVLFTYQDATNLKQREQQSYEALKEAYKAVEVANNAKSNFLSNMSHDIRTPMNAIMGMTAIAAMNIDDPKRIKDCLNKITVSSKHLLGLINEVLDMSKIESGKMILAEEEFNLSDVVDQVITIFLPQVNAKNQDLSASISTVKHEEVIGDSMRLQQIFVNILGNAVKFTPEGGKIRFDIQEIVSDMRGCGCYKFTFEDNGIGMEEEFLDVIFEPFVRANNNRVGKVEGTGLGMPIVKNIVQLMNGNITVDSKINVGSKFTVTVYLKLNHSKRDDVSGLENLPVLVADDDKFACESACNVLNEIGMSADWVLSGDEAIAKLLTAQKAHNDYAAVILDWKMPNKDGVQTAREIRAKVGKDVPIIILSAFDYSEIEDEAREAGVNAFISKPLFRSRLVYVMKSLMFDGEKEIENINHLQSTSYSGKRVLLVEDNDINMEIARELLIQTGVEVECAENGKIAVNRLNEMPPNYYDMVFMDIKMPVMDGYEATEAIRASQRDDLKNLPVIAMTADAFIDDVKHAKAVGMNAHIAKPVEIDKLLKALAEWMK
jgi:signal transduction histidine kinase/DNA-binding response OmpR family regulator